MKLLASLVATLLVAAPAIGAEAVPAPSDARVAMVTECINAAATAHRLPPGVLMILLNVEGGKLGRVSQNTNDTVDIGPMQINQIWIPAVARRWKATHAATRDALLNSFCANVEAGAWILRAGIDEARGDFWEGVAFYHSHTPEHKAKYLRSVLRQVTRLQDLVSRNTAPRLPAAAGG